VICSIIACVLLFTSLSAGLTYPKLPHLRTSKSGNSGCGETSCAGTGTCPNFAFEDWECNANICTYTPINSDNICTEPSQCGTQNCTCPLSSGMSTGCKCSSSNDCDSGACAQGVCQNAYGFLDEYCNMPNNPCFAGVCTDNTCQLVPAGGSCTQDQNCDPAFYCNSISHICQKKPPCSVESNIGYCPDFGTCIQGKCYTYYSIKEGQTCISVPYEGLGDVQFYCEPGLACLGDTHSGYTCQQVPFGTTCNNTFDCEYLTQDCMCVDPDNEVPMQCVDIGFNKCGALLTAALQCFILEGCEYIYDTYNTSNPCGKCTPLIYEASCCNICAYPEFADNAYANIAGSCANNTMTIVPCCSTNNEPCILVTYEQLCAGYPTRN